MDVRGTTVTDAALRPPAEAFDDMMSPKMLITGAPLRQERAILDYMRRMHHHAAWLEQSIAEASMSALGH